MTERQVILECDNPGCDATVDTDDDACDHWLSIAVSPYRDSDDDIEFDLDVCSVLCLAPAVDWALLDAHRSE